MKEKEIIKGYKGFNRDLKCRDFQYELGKEFKTDEKPVACKSGFHFCEYPLDVFNYYSPHDSRFCEVEGYGDSSKEEIGDSKISVSKIKIGVELSIRSLVEATIKFTFDRAKWNKEKENSASAKGAASATGDQGAASATGYQGAASATGTKGAASATGDQGAASATGDQGAASATGDQGAAISIGIKGRAKAKIGGFIVLAEWEQDKNNNWNRVDMKVAKVDGKKIKEDIYYILQNGKIIEIK